MARGGSTMARRHVLCAGRPGLLDERGDRLAGGAARFEARAGRGAQDGPVVGTGPDRRRTAAAGDHLDVLAHARVAGRSDRLRRRRSGGGAQRRRCDGGEQGEQARVDRHPHVLIYVAEPSGLTGRMRRRPEFSVDLLREECQPREHSRVDCVQMQSTLAETRRAPLLLALGPVHRARAAAWTLGFAAPLYLAMRGGGYEAVLRDQVGIALWWVVLVGVLAGVLGLTRPSRAQLTMLAALVGLAAWTGIGALWSQSSGRTVEELSRLSCYAAVLALAIVTVRAGARRALVGGVASAIGAVAVLALLSRLHPAWFPANETAAFLPDTLSRLNYPLNYWNGLAAFAAFGIPLMVYFATSARSIAVRMTAAAALPAMAAVVYLTFSRGGWLELGAAVIVLLALSSDRLWRLAPLETG